MSDNQAIKLDAPTSSANKAMRDKCFSRLANLLDDNKHVAKILESIEALGCTIPKGMFTCIPCEDSAGVSGGFITKVYENNHAVENSSANIENKSSTIEIKPTVDNNKPSTCQRTWSEYLSSFASTKSNNQVDASNATISTEVAVPQEPVKVNFEPKVLICENKVLIDSEFESTILHELIHAYDHCRAKVDLNDCRQYACLEIRASALSGECDYLKEIFRGKFAVKGSNAACVKRRAALSMAMSKCSVNAKETIDSVFDSCYNDFSPFDRETEIP